jgi:hypothetical protein
MDRTEATLAGASRRAGWNDDVRTCVNELGDAFEAHIDDVEAPDGIIADLVASAPRLSAGAAALREDHMRLAPQIKAILTSMSDWEPDRVRSEISEILSELMQHRQLGADLVWEAFNTDIGGQG